MVNSTHKPAIEKLAKPALALAAFVVLLVLLMGPAYRVGLLPLGPIFGGVFPYGSYTAIAVGGLSVIGLLYSAVTRRFASAAMYAVAALLCGGLVTQIVGLRSAARAVPPIHDVSTNINVMPEFRVLTPLAEREELRVPARDPSMESLSPIERWRRYHESAYGDLRSLSLAMPVGDATRLAEEVAKDMGWKIAAADAETGRVEATATTAWFGFKDDVVVRIEANGANSSTVDVRSVSRVGVSDIGANAARIRAYLEALNNLAQADSP